MKFAALLVVVALTGAGTGTYAYRAGQAAATPCAASAATAAPSAGRTFRASNGVVLTADDLDRLDADDRAIEKGRAELEYFFKKNPVKRGAGTTKPDPPRAR